MRAVILNTINVKLSHSVRAVELRPSALLEILKKGDKHDSYSLSISHVRIMLLVWIILIIARSKT